MRNAMRVQVLYISDDLIASKLSVSLVQFVD